MLGKVVAKGGTGTRAQVEAYDVGGKTGTVHSVGASGYEDSSYKAIFAGIAPVENPAVVMVVVVVGPAGDEYYGGEVAAPVFSRVISGAMRLLNVKPDHMPAIAESEKRLQEILGNHKS
jgi:cell division protein FtsI (penicillin-binding protein 3)